MIKRAKAQITNHQSKTDTLNIKQNVKSSNFIYFNELQIKTQTYLQQIKKYLIMQLIQVKFTSYKAKK